MNCTFRALAAPFLILAMAGSTWAALVQPGDIVASQFDNFGTVIVIQSEHAFAELLSLAPTLDSPAMSRPESIVRLPTATFLSQIRSLTRR